MRKSVLAALLFGAALVGGITEGRAHESTRVYPPIGTAAYNAGCTITHTWEDGSALAYCPEDGETWVYDPDGQPVPGIADNPVRTPGWYVAPESLQVGPGAPEGAR